MGSEESTGLIEASLAEPDLIVIVFLLCVLFFLRESLLPMTMLSQLTHRPKKITSQNGKTRQRLES
jgi:hypothetical protein